MIVYLGCEDYDERGVCWVSVFSGYAQKWDWKDAAALCPRSNYCFDLGGFCGGSGLLTEFLIFLNILILFNNKISFLQLISDLLQPFILFPNIPNLILNLICSEDRIIQPIWRRHQKRALIPKGHPHNQGHSAQDQKLQHGPFEVIPGIQWILIEDISMGGVHERFVLVLVVVRVREDQSFEGEEGRGAQVGEGVVVGVVVVGVVGVWETEDCHFGAGGARGRDPVLAAVYVDCFLGRVVVAAETEFAQIYLKFWKFSYHYYKNLVIIYLIIFLLVFLIYRCFNIFRIKPAYLLHPNNF